MKDKIRKILDSRGFIVALLVLLPLIAMAKLVFGPTLAYGDTPYTVPGVSTSNFQYAWGLENFGTTVRQGLFSLRGVFLLAISPNSHIYYILSFLLPILLIFPCYYLLLSKLGVTDKKIKIIAALFALANPVVFGDFSKAQTFWIYITLPWVLYYIINIFYYFKLTPRNFIGLAFSLFLSFGFLPPLILPILAIDGIIALSLLINRIQTQQISFKQYRSLTIGLVGSVVLFALMALPYVLIAPAGQAAFTPASLLGDYYHNYASTDLSNAFRLAGNDGNGMTLMGYNDFSFTNIFGYFFIIIVIASLIVKPWPKFRQLQLSLALPVLLILGLFQVLATNTDIGAKVFQSQFIVSTIRDPAKVIEVLLPVFVVLFACCLYAVIRRIQKPLVKKGLIFAALASVLVYGWPIFTGNLGLFINRDDTIDDYKPSKTVSEIVKNEANNKGRAVIIPSGHSDELNYQAVSPSLNALRLGGSLPGGSALVKELQTSVTNNSDYLNTLLRIADINSVYLKTNEAAYAKKAFGLLGAPSKSFEESNSIIASKLTLEKADPNYVKYVTPYPFMGVYSPNVISTTDDKASLHEILPLMTQNEAVLQSKKQLTGKYVKQYASVENMKKGQTIGQGFAQLYSPKIIQFKYRVENQSNGLHFKMYRIHPITQELGLEKDLPLDAAYTQLVIDGKAYELSDAFSSLSLRDGEHEITFGQQSKRQNDSDLSFESNAYVGDASNTRPGEAQINGSINKSEKTEGSASLAVTSKSHVALVSRKIKIDPNIGIYKINFDYKKNDGSSFSYGIFNGQKIVGSRVQINEKSDKWNTHKDYFYNADKLSEITVNFYVDPAQSGSGKVLLDNLAIYNVRVAPSTKVNIAQYKSDYLLSNYSPNKPNVEIINLLSNGSFENEKDLGEIGDATITSGGQAQFDVKQSTDAVEGKKSLYLGSKNHTVYIRKPVRNFDTNKIYKVSFRYKHIKGGQPAFTVWQDGVNAAAAYQSLNGNGKWQTFEKVFMPTSGSTGMSLYLYSPSIGRESVNLFDDVKIEEQDPVSNYLYIQKDAAESPMPIVDKFKRVNPTQVLVDMRKGNGAVIFNESYHMGWKAFIVPQNYSGQSFFDYISMKLPGAKIEDSAHAIANGYANGWLINQDQIPESLTENGKYKILLEYWPQRLYVKTFIVALIVMAACAIYFIGPPGKKALKLLIGSKMGNRLPKRNKIYKALR